MSQEYPIHSVKCMGYFSAINKSETFKGWYTDRLVFFGTAGASASMQDGKNRIKMIRITIQKTPTIRIIIKIQRRKRKKEMEMQEKERSRSSRQVMRHPLFFLLPLGCAAFCLLLHRCLKARKKNGAACSGCKF